MKPLSRYQPNRETNAEDPCQADEPKEARGSLRVPVALAASSHRSPYVLAALTIWMAAYAKLTKAGKE